MTSYFGFLPRDRRQCDRSGVAVATWLHCGWDAAHSCRGRGGRRRAASRRAPLWLKLQLSPAFRACALSAYPCGGPRGFRDGRRRPRRAQQARLRPSPNLAGRRRMRQELRQSPPRRLEPDWVPTSDSAGGPDLPRSTRTNPEFREHPSPPVGRRTGPQQPPDRTGTGTRGLHHQCWGFTSPVDVE
jgi:hypothetical protein